MSGKSGVGSRAWVVTLLAAAFMTINFMDKAILGVVANALMTDLKIGPSEFGMIASSFFILFSLSSALFGFIANRVSSRIVLLVLAIIWGCSQFPLAFIVSVPLLFFSRILLGFGEGPAYPMALHAAYKWFDNDKRNLPSAVIFQGITVGLLISGPLLTAVTIRYTYHAAFFVLGTLSLIWGVVWFFFGKDGNKDHEIHARHEATPVSYKLLLLDWSFIGNMVLYWGTYCVFSVMFTWVPSYLSSVLKFTPRDTGWMFMLFTATSVPLVMGASALSQRLLKQGVSSQRARVWVAAGSVILGGALILGATTANIDPFMRAVLLAIGMNIPQISFVLSSTIVAEISPASQRSSLMSINSALATSGGLVAPAIVGRLIQNAPNISTGYNNSFLALSFVAIFCGVFGLASINLERSKRRFLEGSDVESVELAWGGAEERS